jgi:hypothetical protein
MILLIVSVLVLVAAVVLLLRARRKLARAKNWLSLAEDKVKLALSTLEAASTTNKETEHERELAGALLAHVQKIEDSLVNPRFALDLKIGRIRALRYHEDPRPGEEVETRDPDPDCRKCFGRGWNGRQRETGQVVPCPCIRRRG